jgi:hypothetical protein
MSFCIGSSNSILYLKKSSDTPSVSGVVNLKLDVPGIIDKIL